MANERRKEEQITLFESDPEWKKHWEGMPEYTLQDLRPIKALIINFETEEDLQVFSKLIGQPLTMNTRSIWYPEADIGRLANKRYVDES